MSRNQQKEKPRPEEKSCYIEQSYLTAEQADLYCSKQDSCEECKYYPQNYLKSENKKKGSE